MHNVLVAICLWDTRRNRIIWRSRDETDTAMPFLTLLRIAGGKATKPIDSDSPACKVF